ncbi:hypothetical protein M513_07469 [Trichuris suis]|uniref:EGF-like domain-containing protein n=1 Tax=Trichuris suis TaxID=68888 RepID=A0A085M2Z4_9BILA|nr:hypothetical protein M513_07469 [Trichuris suis]
MKIKITLFIYCLFTAEVSSRDGERYIRDDRFKGTDPFIPDENYMERLMQKCKELFDVFPQLTPQHYQFSHYAPVNCRYHVIHIKLEDLQRRKRSASVDDYELVIPESEHYGVVALQGWPPDVNNDLYSGCDINDPVYEMQRYAAIDCGAFNNDCIYRRSIYGRTDYYPGMKFIVLDGARILKRIKRVIKGTINYRVTLILSLGNGTHMNLNYTVKAFSYVEINQTDPFYFAHGDLLKLYRETRFPLCIYRAWETEHSQYYPCRTRWPKKYFWDKTINRLHNHAGLKVFIVERRMLPKYEKRDHPLVTDRGTWFTHNYRCFDLLCPYSSHRYPTFTGLYCEQNLDECAYDAHNCPPGWDCHDTNTSYYCECPAGTTGTNCSQDVDECEEGTHDCPIYSTCRNTNGSYTCICPSWFTGKYCNEFIDYCIIYKPCRNGGKCHPLQNNYHCECPAGYTGKNCTDDIDECHSNPCGTHGTCENGVNKYTCKCEPAYTGWRCDVEINECKNQNLQCKHGICVRVEETKYKCDCHPGYTGRLCDTDIDECLDKSICGWNGNCRNEVGSFKCECLDGFRGDRCQHEIDECQSDPCQNGGYCLDGRNDYECICQLGYKGTHCEHIIDHCKSHECENEGSCINLPYGYRCDCPSYATGTFCEDLIDNCVDEYQCGEGYCRNLKGSYECICDDGYTDKNCKTKVDRCADIECRNGGKLLLYTMALYGSVPNHHLHKNHC